MATKYSPQEKTDLSHFYLSCHIKQYEMFYRNVLWILPSKDQMKIKISSENV